MTSDRTVNFVVFSDDWGRHPSSCQHLFKLIARDHRVLWVNTLGLRAAKPDRFTFFRGLEKFRQWLCPLVKINDNLHVLSPIMLPVFGSGLLARINRTCTAFAIRQALKKLKINHPIFWTSVPTGVDYLGCLGESAVVYYVTDDYSLWPGANADLIRAADRKLTQQADLIFACSQPLADTHFSTSAATVLLPHAVEFDHFSTPRPEPPELAAIPHPRACFFGLIYEKIDLTAIADLARNLPNIHIVMIGPVKTDVTRLTDFPNVHFLGPRPYDALPAYLHAMDIMIVPYIPDAEIQASGPLKIRECLAVGKPAVVRALPDLEPFADVLHLYRSSNDFLPAVRCALDTNSFAAASDRINRVKNDTWSARVDTIMTHLSSLHSSASTQPFSPADLYCNAQKSATLFHDSRWAEIFQRAYNCRPFHLTVSRNGQIAGTLQLIEQKSILFGSHLTALPYFDSAGILADDDHAAQSLLDQASDILTARRVKWIELRQSAPLPGSLPIRKDKVTLKLDLPDNPDILWKSLDAKVRNQIRKSQSANLTFHVGQEELLDDFLAVYIRNMRDLGSPPHHKIFFRLILRNFCSETVLFVVCQNQTPLAAAFTFADRQTFCVPWAANDWRFRKLCPNMLLYWNMLEYAVGRKMKTFDFGRSSRNSGTYRFKRQWGAREIPLYWHYLLPPGFQLPDLRHDSPKFRFFVAAWKKLPLPLARTLGPHIIRSLS